MVIAVGMDRSSAVVKSSFAELLAAFSGVGREDDLSDLYSGPQFALGVGNTLLYLLAAA